MLLNVHVKDLALIEDVDICFGDGLNILTGETGAGKSIIIGSIGVALGAKAGKDLIRQGAGYALVELVFQVESKETLDKLKDMDIDAEDGQIIIARKISNGKSLIKINGQTMTASALKEIASLLIDVHGQRDYETLVHTEKHLDILDAFASDSVLGLKEKVSGLYKEYKAINNKLLEFTKDEEQRAKDLAFYEFQAKEIEDADLVVGEDEELEVEFKKMTHGQKIAEAMGIAYEAISSDEGAVIRVGLALKELGSVSNLDDDLSSIYDSLSSIDALCYDISKEMSSYMDKLDFDEERVAFVSERLDTINKLKLKHGKTISDILDKKAWLDEQIEALSNYDEARRKLEKDMEKALQQLEEVCSELSNKRKKAALSLEKEITKALVDLNFLEVKFKADFTRAKDYTAKGFDVMEFMISTNPGEEVKPLAKIASGGELSRIMLGLKAVLAKKDAVDTLIFDEIDTGISGKTAGMVADKMSAISKEHQVISITHLPQIASHADSHYLIEKSVKDKHTFTDIRKLNNEESVNELARMLGGTVITDAALDNARELKRLAGKE
ncbi:MAG: DNA repair protein RecN [Lachnospiraceae bacterium]|nr:DNA repair protein RecN [Lachnospiraceae bacterium]